MTTSENNFFTMRQKNLFTLHNLQVAYDPDSINEDLAISNYFTKPYNETDSFIVDWQMSTDEN